jgi:Cu2+-exporting ATPase
LYNLLALPLAATGFIPPWAAAIGMSLSSLIVVGNALRLLSTDHKLSRIQIP